jgi:hypothetical protein
MLVYAIQGIIGAGEKTKATLGIENWRQQRGVERVYSVEGWICKCSSDATRFDVRVLR